MGVNSLLGSLSCGNTVSSQLITVPSLSQYRYIYCCLSITGAFGNILDDSFMTTYMFKFTSKTNDRRLYLRYDDTRYGQILYNTDTSVYILGLNVAVYIYGIK